MAHLDIRIGPISAFLMLFTIISCYFCSSSLAETCLNYTECNQMAINATFSDDYSSAIELLNKALLYTDEEQKTVCKMNIARVYFNLGLTQLSNEDYTGADNSFGKAIDNGMATEDAYIYKGYALLFAKDYFHAVQHFEVVVKYNPNNLQARYLLSIALVYFVPDLQSNSQVTAWLKNNQIKGLGNLNVSNYTICGTLYNGMSVTTNYQPIPIVIASGSIRDISNAITTIKSGNQYAAICPQGREYYKYFALPESVESVIFTKQEIKALRLPLIHSNNNFALPDSAAYVQRGQTYLRAARYEKAIEDFTTALDMNPENANALLNRADAYKAMGNKMHEARDLQKFLSIKMEVNDEQVVLAKKRLEELIAENQEEQK